MSTPVTEEEFAAMFGAMTSDAFRMETRGTYALEYEEGAFRAFLEGNPQPPTDVDWWSPWLDQVATFAQQGKRIERVRLLASTDYQRWMRWADPWHAQAGELIRYMSRTRAAEAGIPVQDDWWLFDSSRLVLMAFTSEGRLGGKQLITDPLVVHHYRQWRDLAIRHSTLAGELAAA